LSGWVGWGFEGLGGVERTGSRIRFNYPKTLFIRGPGCGRATRRPERSISRWGNASVPEKAPDKPRREIASAPTALSNDGVSQVEICATSIFVVAEVETPATG